MNFAGHHTSARTHGLFGWTSLSPNAVQASASIESMSEALSTNLPIATIESESSACGSTGQVAQLGVNGCVAIFGNPIWKCTSLQDQSLQQGHAQALVKAYQQHGLKCLELLYNDFSCAIIDSDNNKIILAVDHLGRYPLYYTLSRNQLVFASTAKTVLAHPSITREIDPQGLYNYVYFHMVPGPSSVYKNLSKLQAGTALEISSGQSRIHRYWTPGFSEFHGDSFTRKKNELRHTLTQSVERATAGKNNVGAFLSGGLDSSTVAGILSETSQDKARAFSIGFDAEGYDEMAYARITAKHFGIELNEYYVTPEDVVTALPMVATSYDEPFGNSSALPAWFCARFARENGIELLLAGDGGDELFAGNERYAKQKLFEIYGQIPRLLREGLIEPGTSLLKDRLAVFAKAASYIEQASTPLPDRLQSYNFLHRHAPNEIFAQDFLESVETELPLTIQRDVYNAPTDASKLNRMLYLDWQFTLADNDLRKVSHMCATAGVDVAYPMLDDELLDFSCKIPSNEKLRGQNLRDFYKKSLTGWLPDETINKSKQGFGLPFGVWMQEHKPLREMAYDNLVALKNRNYLDNRFLDKLIGLHKDEHAAYYGELIWVLTVFELWMDRN